MKNQRTPFYAANWKMNKTFSELTAYVKGLSSLSPGARDGQFELVLAPQALQLVSLGRELEGTPFQLGAQNAGPGRAGAFTGEISPAALKEINVRWVILGHSERRHLFKEDDALIRTRLRAVLEEGLNAILCVGEVLQDRKTQKTFKVVESQLSILKETLSSGFSERVVIAYEPVWAIGTGENATPAQAQEVHAYIRQWVAETLKQPADATKLRILYGGSVKPDNATSLMGQPDVDGFLVGTSSLDSTTFTNVVINALKSRS